MIKQTTVDMSQPTDMERRVAQCHKNVEALATQLIYNAGISVLDVLKKNKDKLYLAQQRAYYAEDLAQYLEDNYDDVVVTDEMFDTILESLLDNYDSDLGHWTNLENAIDHILEH